MVFSLVSVTAAYKKNVNDFCYKLYYDVSGYFDPCVQCVFHGFRRSCIEVFYLESAKLIWCGIESAISMHHPCDLPTENENSEPEQSPSEEDELDLMKNEMNGQTTDDDQDEEVEVVNEESPTSEDLELMVEEPRYVEPANAWLNVDINDQTVRDIAETAVVMDPRVAERTKKLHLRSVQKKHINGCIYKLSLDLTGPGGLIKCNVVVTENLYFEFKKVKFVEWNPVEPWSRSQVDTKDVDPILLGNFDEVDVDDVTVQDMAYHAVAHLNDKKVADQ